MRENGVGEDYAMNDPDVTRAEIFIALILGAFLILLGYLIGADSTRDELHEARAQRSLAEQKLVSVYHQSAKERYEIAEALATEGELMAEAFEASQNRLEALPCAQVDWARVREINAEMAAGGK